MQTIKEIRQSVQMTQKQFAEFLGIPKRTIENWEMGQRSPPEYVINLIKSVISNKKNP